VESFASMSSSDLHPNRLANLRRSQRVCLSVPVVVSKAEAGKPSASEETRTLIVSAHGALLELRMAVNPGDVLTLKHQKTEEELRCRVVNFGAEQSSKREVGVEFEVASPRFWRIAFPPADWSPRGPDSKPPTPQSASAKMPQRKPIAVSAEVGKAQVKPSPGSAQG
jgi:hypothetical protein